MRAEVGKLPRMPTGTELIETHAHLDSPRFADDCEQVISRAVGRGVAQIITVGTSIESSRAAIVLAEQYQPVYATIGVHPHDSTGFSQQALEELADLASHPKTVAIGEIGIDYYRDYAPREDQLAAFQMQLALASKVGKPVVVHIRDRKGTRDAYETVIESLTAWIGETVHEADAPPGVLHCYSGELDTARQALDLGFYLGVDGPITYPNADDLRALVAKLSLERLLLETDCPYLTPQPRRGQRNEPAFLPYIADQLAQVCGVSPEEVARTTTVNARRLFGLPATSQIRQIRIR